MSRRRDASVKIVTRITQARRPRVDTTPMDKRTRSEHTANAALATRTGKPALTPEQLAIIKRLGA